MNRTIATLLIALNIFPLMVWGEEFNINEQSVVITTSGTYLIKGNKNQETNNSIVVQTGVKANITLENVNINSSTCAFDIQGNAAVTLILKEENVLKSANDYAGIHCENSTDDIFTDVNNTASLTIQGNGKLTVTGGKECAGIGGTNGWKEKMGGHGGFITIENGTIVAKGGDYGAGIGGGSGGSGGRITIKGGNITATGSHDASGIGGGSNYDGYFNGGRIIITGGQITATAGKNAHAIGRGSGNNKTDCLIIGPDATIKVNGEITEYSNGFSFYNNQTEATVKGNPVIPTGTVMTINTGKTLIVPEQTTFTIDGIINNNGTITNKGTITGKGAIACNIPSGWNGKKAYMVSYDLNGGSGTSPATGYQAEGKLELPQYSSFSKTNYTCIGWNTETTSKTALAEYTVIEGENKLYAVWVKNLSLTTTTKEITGKVGDAFSEVKLSDLVTTDPEVGEYQFSVKNGSLPIDFNLAEDGTLSFKNEKLTQTLTDQKVTLSVTPKSGAQGADLTLTFTISPVKLVVTPTTGQFLYQDEKPEEVKIQFSYSGNLESQTPGFTGSLKWDIESKRIVNNDLQLADNEAGNFTAANYELEVLEQAFDYYETNIADEEATIDKSTASNDEGWNDGNVTLNAPANFKIKRITDIVTFIDTEWTATSITIDTEGENQEIKYQLKRDGRELPNEQKSITLHIDKTAPSIGKPVNGTDGRSFTLELTDALSGIATVNYNLDNTTTTTPDDITPGEKSYTLTLGNLAYGTHSIEVTVLDQAGHTTIETRSIELKKPVDPTPTPDPTPIFYTVTLPSIEGVTTDPVAGSYEVEAWDNFRFYLTLDKEYDQSKPVVTTDRNETLIPRSSDGAYLVKYIRQPVRIFIDSIVKNPDPVANETIATDGTEVRTADHCLYIRSTVKGQAAVYDFNGKLLKQARLLPGETRWQFPSGIYIVEVNGKRYKVML